MKKFYAPLIALVLFASCIGYKELPVEYDYSYKGNFKKYRTFRYHAINRCNRLLDV
jgi:hypothetical protein